MNTHQNQDSAAQSSSPLPKPRQVPTTGRHGHTLRKGGVLLSGLVVVAVLSRPFDFRHTTAQTVSLQQDAAIQEASQAQELDQWLGERTDRQILIIDQLVSRRKHPGLTEQEVVEFGMLHSAMILRVHEQVENRLDREGLMRTQDRILNPERYNGELRGRMTPLELEREKVALDAFFNAFPQTPPSPAPRISIPASEEGGRQ